MSVADRAERVLAWRDRGVPEDVVAVCAEADRLDDTVRTARDRHPHAFIAALPRSGGRWLRDALGAAAGLANVPLDGGARDEVPTVARSRVPAFLARPSVALHEGRATAHDLEWVDRIGLRPIVVVRPVFEVIGLVATDLDLRNGPPAFAHLAPQCADWPVAERAALVARTLGPRLLSAVASWIDAARDRPVLRVTHADLVRAPAGCVRAAAAHAGLALDEPRLESALGTLGPPPASVGPELPDSVRRELRALAAFYADDYDLRSLEP